MPTSVLGVAFYVFALIPGVVFLFAREGHRPVGKRSALRETATVIFVSTICDGIVALAVIAGAVAQPELYRVVVSMLSGDMTWARENFPLAALILAAAFALATIFAWLLGSKFAHDKILNPLWRAEIDRDTSAWSRILHPDKDVEVRVGLNLKSGTWVSGTLYHFDNDPDSNPHRAITLNGEIRVRPQGESEAQPLAETDWLIVEAGEIEMLQAAYYEPATGPETRIAERIGKLERFFRFLAVIGIPVLAIVLFLHFAVRHVDRTQLQDTLTTAAPAIALGWALAAVAWLACRRERLDQLSQ